LVKLALEDVGADEKNKPSIALLQPLYPCSFPGLGDLVGASRTGLP